MLVISKFSDVAANIHETGGHIGALSAEAIVRPQTISRVHKYLPPISTRTTTKYEKELILSQMAIVRTTSLLEHTAQQRWR